MKTLKNDLYKIIAVVVFCLIIFNPKVYAKKFCAESLQEEDATWSNYYVFHKEDFDTSEITNEKLRESVYMLRLY